MMGAFRAGPDRLCASRAGQRPPRVQSGVPRRRLSGRLRFRALAGASARARLRRDGAGRIRRRAARQRRCARRLGGGRRRPAGGRARCRARADPRELHRRADARFAGHRRPACRPRAAGLRGAEAGDAGAAAAGADAAPARDRRPARGRRVAARRACRDAAPLRPRHRAVRPRRDRGARDAGHARRDQCAVS